MKEKEIKIGGLKVNYKTAESKDAYLPNGRQILILHGWPSSSDVWVNIINKLAEQGYSVFCPDFPGFGKSDNPPEGGWSVDDYLNWFVDFINYLKIDKFILLGHSFGGRISIKFSARYPEKLEKLILCGSAGLKVKPGIKASLIRILAESGNCIFCLRFLSIFRNLSRNLLYVFIRKSDYVRAEGVMRETLKKVVKEDLRPYLHRIKTETLLIWGKDDKMIPIKYAKIFKKEINNSKLEIIPGVGHGPHLEVPEKFLELIIRFLKP